MRKLLLLAIITTSSLISYGQKEMPEFGKIDISDLRMSSCSFEPDANAMKLFEVVDAEFEPSAFGGKIRTYKRVRIKIFNEKGFPSATIKIPYYNNKNNTKVEELRGNVYTISPSGEVITRSLTEDDFYKEKATANVGILRFTFPDLKPNCVIEYSYMLTQKNLLAFDTWVLQSDIPVAYSSCAVTIPAYSTVRSSIFGSDSIAEKKIDITKGLDKEKRIYYKEHIRSFQAEPFMSSYADNILRMGFMLNEDGKRGLALSDPRAAWRTTAAFLLRSPLWDDQTKKVIPGTEKIVDTAVGYPNVSERIKYLYNIVKKRIPFRESQIAFPQSVEETWKKKTGSSAEMNMLLINLMKRSGITCHPVLVSTRENGKINTDMVNFGQFNGLDVLAIADGNSYLIDASLKYQSHNTPPLNILNREAFLLDPDNIRWVMVTDDRPLLKQTTDIFGALKENGIMECGATITYYDYAKSIFLDTTIGENDNREEKFFDKKVPGLKVLSERLENVETDDPLMQIVEFDYETNTSGDFIFVNPQLLSSKKLKPFTNKNRTTDVDFGSNQEIRLAMQLDLPTSYQVETLPQNITIRSSDSSFVFTRISSVSQSKLSYLQLLEIKKPIFTKEEYAALYDFFNQLRSFIAEEIILKKKK